MPVTITYAGGTVPAPTLALSGSQNPSSESGNVVHELMNGKLAFTLRPARPAQFTLELIYAAHNVAAGSNYATARAALTALSLPTVYTYSNTDPALTLRFVVAGSIRLEQAADGADVYRLSIDAREVP